MSIQTRSRLFEEVLARLEKVKGPNSEGFYSVRCPYHDDEHPSAWLHPRAGLGCFACGVRKSVKELAEDLGLRFKAHPHHHPASKTVICKGGEGRKGLSLQTTVSEAERPSELEREDVAGFLKEYGFYEKANRFAACGKEFWRYRCVKCGAPIARARYCELPFCPDCRRRHRNLFFRRHREKLEKGQGTYFVFRWGVGVVPFGLLRRAVEEKVKVLKKLRQGVAQDSGHPISGLYGVSFKWTPDGWDVWLTVLLRCQDEDWIKLYMLSVGAYRLIFHDNKRFDSLDDAWSYFCYLNPYELLFGTKDELVEIVKAVSRVRLYQGFGDFYRVSGWKGGRPDERPKCPFCGGELEFLGSCSSSYIRVWFDEDEGVALWGVEEGGEIFLPSL